MDSSQVKKVLQLYRPGTTDALDPQMAEALQAVQLDPELAHWFDEHCGVYIAIRGKLKQVEVPPDLKRKILLENVGRRRIIPFTLPAVWLLAAAAAIALLAAASWVFFKPGKNDSFAAYRQREVLQVQRGYAMTMTSTNLNEIREFLRASHSVADYALPKGLENLTGEGCAALRWHGKPVAMVCLNAGMKKDLFLFVASRSDFSNPPRPGKPQFDRVHKLTTASWITGDKVYILAGAGDPSELQQYLD
ncbi:MAG: hypothetical protein JWR69_1387 [Pedosphaera sp.]|nr:hypothetical protein [Pedosphaera sp.]